MTLRGFGIALNTQLHRFFRVGLAFGLPLYLVGCERDEPLAPDMLVAARAGSGGTVNAPSGTNAVARSYSQIDVSWIDNSSNESGFEVHRSTTGPSGSFALVASLAANVTSLGNTGLSGSTQYCYEVHAFRISGNTKSYSSFSNIACATTPAPPVPAAPSNAHAAPHQGRWIDVSWTDNSTNETGFRVERAPARSGPWASAGTPSLNTTALNDFFSFQEEHTYCYRVFAVNSYGDSPASNVLCTAVPAYPTNLAATVNGDGSAELTWTDNSAVEDGYQIWQAFGCCDQRIVVTLPANATTYHLTGLTPDSPSLYSVRAARDGGSSDYQGFVTVVFATTPPAPPTALGVAPTSSSSVAGSWSDISTNESGFRIERSTDDGLSWSTIPANGFDTFEDSGLPSEQPACYRVIAFNGVGDSPPSNTDCTTPPAGPTDLSATINDDTSIDLAWTDNSAVEDGYEVWVDGGDGNSFAIALPPNTTSFELPAGWCGYCYWHYVVAIKDAGHSDFSNVWVGSIPPPAGASSVRPGSTSLAPTARHRRAIDPN